ncbi:uncharacterized protein [Euphorbia lathyris]|uniref:uncharacterized protein isoform X2 n=1 Tax=Euphorbia lathyris TaxID=212925 RepID=UPI0033139A6C
MSSSTTDDVDRLFNCFKCGISPPQSAVRERKRSKSKLKQGNGVDEVPSVSGTPSSGSAPRAKKKNAIDAQITMEKLGSNTVKGNNSSCGKQISPIVFYGSPHGVPPKRPISLLRLLNEIRINLTEGQKSNLRKGVWTTFPRQNEALNFAKEHVNVHVFSYQDHHYGQRRFLVSTYEEFWRRYKNMDPKFRHHYEVIQEGSPCHLYFDLEFDRRENQEKNGDQMVDLLISVIFEAFLEKYSIQGNDEWIVELDSSTAEKFSRHLIFHIPGTAFKDNSHAGAFVSEICSRISSARERYGRFGELYVLKDSSADSASQLFVDTAVYSRNRVFRLALSSKAGKTSILVPTGRFKCKEMENYYSRRCNYAQANATSRTYEMGNSPFPSLDKFVESIASVGSVSGKIRSWYWFSEDGLIVYSMLRNRYCERIGREHKSNHVMYVVDLKRDFYYQKCYDPDCQGYRSPLRPIPVNLIPDPYAYDSVQVVHHNEMTNSNLDCQYGDNGCERVLLYNDGNDMEGCQDSWWLEAIRVADDVECKQKRMELGERNIDEDGDDWWMAVERTASQAEVVAGDI